MVEILILWEASNLTKTTQSWALCPIGSSPSGVESSRNSSCDHWPGLQFMSSKITSHIKLRIWWKLITSVPIWWRWAVVVVLDGLRDDLWRRSRTTASLNWTCQTKPPICICNPSATSNLPIKRNQLNTDLFSPLAKWFWVNFLWKSQIRGFECHAWGGCETYLRLESSLKIKFNPQQSLSNWA